MWHIFNTVHKNNLLEKRYIQLALDNSKIIGVCGVNDNFLSSLNRRAGFSLELSEYARQQFSIPANRKDYTEALGVVTHNLGQVHVRIYKFRKKKGNHSYKKFKYDYYIDWVG